jgi:hypothetical protein
VWMGVGALFQLIRLVVLIYMVYLLIVCVGVQLCYLLT